MKRRTFTGLLGGAAATAPFAARAQQATMPVIAFLHSGSAEQNVRHLASFRKGLADAGFVEGRNLAIEFRWTVGQNARLPELAAELIAKQVTLIAALSSTPAAMAAKAATGTVPIFFLIADPPVELGLVASFNRRGGNATGIVTLNIELMPKRLEFLRELAPQTANLAVLLNSNHPSTKSAPATLRATASTLGLPLQILEAVSDAEIEAAYAALKPGSALLIGTDASFFARRAKLVALSARHAVPTIYDNIESGPCRRPNHLWRQRRAPVGAGRRRRRPHPQGPEAGRAAGRASDAVRAGHQSQDRQGARARDSAKAAGHGRRGDRVRLMAAVIAAP